MLIFIYSITSQMFHKYGCVMLHQLTNKLNNSLMCYSIQICRNQISSNVAGMQTPHPQSVYTYVGMHLLVCNRDKDRERKKGGEKRGRNTGNKKEDREMGYNFKRTFMGIKDLCHKSNCSVRWKCKCTCLTRHTTSHHSPCWRNRDRERERSLTEPSFSSSCLGHLLQSSG